MSGYQTVPSDGIVANGIKKFSYSPIQKQTDIEMVQSVTPTRLDREYLHERNGYSSQSYTDEAEILVNDKIGSKSKYFKAMIVSSALLFGAAVIFTVSAMNFGNTPTPLTSDSQSTSKFDSKGRYIMSNFDKVKPMSNFLNGLGGMWGVPMWAFYVNRGQGITSFGKQNKDSAFLKFNTAEKAYQETPFIGFRTFLKGRRGISSFSTMPFYPRPTIPNDPIKRDMIIGENEMEIQEVDPANGLQTNIVYFTVPEEDFPAFVRTTTFTNLDSTEILTLEVLDGLGRLIPSGLNNNALDGMGRTMEAWMNVYNVQTPITQPFFHISQDTADTAQVHMIKDGHFAISFVDGGFGEEIGPDGLHKMLPFIVDPSVVYETDTTLTDPIGFFAPDAPSVSELLLQPQGATSRTPCAFAGAKLVVPPGKSVSISTIFGHADNLETFVGTYSPKLLKPGYTSKKRAAAQHVVEQITKKVETKTSSPIFDAYVKQDFLDNVLRGGLPIALGDSEKPKIYHTFSRIHGDIERDYNFFQIDTTYFSQGPGNFRDVSQNRRLDVLHTPAVGDFNLRMFLSYVQADAYNPLTVASTNFKVPTEKLADLVSSLEVKNTDGSGSGAAAVTAVLKKAFRPGQFFKDVTAAGASFSIGREDVLDKLMTVSDQVPAAQYAQNGYWADHWTYTMDLLDNYLAVFPDKEEYVLWESEPVPFFMSPAIVKSRADRYNLVDNALKPGTSTIRVYSALSVWGEKDFSAIRQNAMNAIFSDSQFVADSVGAGGVWQRSRDLKVFTVSAIAKLTILGTLKFSTLDPYGMGVEMEGGKPGWNDAMNGLPGIVGSGMSETYEMLRIIKYVKATVLKFPERSVSLPIEFSAFLADLSTALDTFFASPKDQSAEFTYWDSSNNAREKYRAAVVGYFDGQKTNLSSDYMVSLISKMELKVAGGIRKALATNKGLSPSYFYYECDSFEMLAVTVVSDPPQATRVAAKSFKLHTLPLFLEGPVRHMKVIENLEERRGVYQKVKNSGLYDTALKMYTLSESLVGMGQDIGRMMAFSPGWLENQSVWLHMSYKWYLELLRGGLYEEFFEEIKTGLVPFMDNKVYGRSPLEAASFIVSSAFPDPKLHGASFLARLSGSTAEMLSMWAIMMAGPNPFVLDGNNNLKLQFAPILPGWLFAEDGTASFTFLGSVLVTYVNPTKADTWKISPTSATITGVDGHTELVPGGVLGSVQAARVRNLEIKSITVFYN